MTGPGFEHSQRPAAGPARRLVERLAEGAPLRMDGATGTELERLGIRSSLPLWSAHALFEAPQSVLEVHRGYVAAGAEVLTANTFRTQRRTLARGHHGERARQLTEFAVDLARRATEAAPHPVWVLGSAPPLEDCYRPDLVPDADALAAEHAEHAANLVAAGVDAILAETHNNVGEAVAAARAAREAGAEVLVAFVCEGGPRLLSGEPLAEGLAAVAEFAPLAVGVNCLPPDEAEACLATLVAADAPFFVYANLGRPAEDGSFGADATTSPEAFAAHGRRWLAAGARAVGGCCGTTADHIEALCAVVPSAESSRD